jgi:hypothetical protein
VWAALPLPRQQELLAKARQVLHVALAVGTFFRKCRGDTTIVVGLQEANPNCLGWVSVRHARWSARYDVAISLLDLGSTAQNAAVGTTRIGVSV